MKIKNLLAFVCTILMILSTSQIAYCAPDAVEGIPEYTGVCGVCGSRSWDYIQERWTERKWQTTCPNADTGAIHTHYMVTYYDDYMCSQCGVIATRYSHSQEFCPIGNMTRYFGEWL